MHRFWQVTSAVALVLLFLGPLVYGYRQIEDVRDSYQRLKPATTQSAAQSTEAKTATVPDPLNQQNKQMIDWAVLLLGGSVALSTTTKLHRFKIYKTLYLLLIGPASGFLLASLWCGVVFQRRVAYLSIQTEPESFEALISFLRIESNLLTWGVCLLAVFALCFLFGIVLGFVDPCEKP